LTPDQAAAFRAYLTSEERTLSLVDAFLEQERQKWDVDVRWWFDLACDTFVRGAVRHIFRHAESPIEQIFLNALVIHFLKFAPLHLIVIEPTDDEERSLKLFLDRGGYCREGWLQYRRLTGRRDYDEYKEWLDDSAAKGLIQPLSLVEEIHTHTIMYHDVGLWYSYHLILQPRFPTIKIQGKPIRPDMLFWIPAHPTTRLIVECDGFIVHRTREQFIKDRQRDRALKAAGYDVLRYSGSEIHQDPVGVGLDLMRLLLERHPPRPLFDDPLQEEA